MPLNYRLLPADWDDLEGSWTSASGFPTHGAVEVELHGGVPGTAVIRQVSREINSLRGNEGSLASLTIANSNRLAGWLRAMDSLRQAIGTAA